MGTRRTVIQRPLRPRISAVAIGDYKIYCENDDFFHGCADSAPYQKCETCTAAFEAWQRLYRRFGLKPWLPHLPAIQPAEDTDQQWAAALEEALRHCFSNDKSKVVRRNGGGAA
jgi:predicted TIM-barrel fold metal-dependent hydrolase